MPLPPPVVVVGGGDAAAAATTTSEIPATASVCTGGIVRGLAATELHTKAPL